MQSPQSFNVNNCCGHRLPLKVQYEIEWGCILCKFEDPCRFADVWRGFIINQFFTVNVNNSHCYATNSKSTKNIMTYGQRSREEREAGRRSPIS